MPLRSTIAFEAVAGTKARPLYLTRTGKLSADRAEAVRFTLRASPLVRERLTIDQRVHALAGGLGEWLDLQEGIEKTRAALRAEITRVLGKDADAQPGTPEERTEQEAELEKAWVKTDRKLRAGFAEMMGLSRRLEWMARWAVLFVSAEVAGQSVEGWTDVAEVELDDAAMDALWSCHEAALTQDEADSGKAPPSAS